MFFSKALITVAVAFIAVSASPLEAQKAEAILWSNADCSGAQSSTIGLHTGNCGWNTLPMADNNNGDFDDRCSYRQHSLDPVLHWWCRWRLWLLWVFLINGLWWAKLLIDSDTACQDLAFTTHEASVCVQVLNILSFKKLDWRIISRCLAWILSKFCT